MSRPFDEINVYDCVAERTGNQVAGAAIRGRAGLCRSLTELSAKSRRLGDGYYYLAVGQWPADVPKIDMNRPWQTLG